MATTIDLRYTGILSTGVTVSAPSDSRYVVSLNVTSGTYKFIYADRRVDIDVTQATASLNFVDSSFSRQLGVKLPKTNTCTITLNNIDLDASAPDEDDYNLNFSGTGTTKLHLRNVNMYVGDGAQPVNIPESVQITLSTGDNATRIYLANEVDSSSELEPYLYTIKNSTISKNALFLIGKTQYHSYISFVDAVSTRLDNVYIQGDVTLIDSYLERQVTFRVNTGYSLTLKRCNFSQYSDSPTGSLDWTGDGCFTLITLLTEDMYSGNIIFDPSTKLSPRVEQVKERVQVSSKGNGTHRIMYCNSGWNKFSGAATIHQLPSDYTTYNTLYSDASVIKNSIIDLDSGDYTYGSNEYKVSFDLNFIMDKPTSAANIELFVNGGDIWYANNYTIADETQSSVQWSGCVIGRNNQNGGRDTVFDTSGQLALDFSGLTLVANAGNNVISTTATQGIFSGYNYFSYYPSDLSYNLMLENPIVIGTSASPISIPLYNGSGSYNFYANSIRPWFYFGQTENANTFDLGTDTIDFSGSYFGNGIRLYLGSSTVNANNCTFDLPDNTGACIDLFGGVNGGLILNSDSTKEGYMNDFYVNTNNTIIFLPEGNQNAPTVTYGYNKYHFEAGTWNLTTLSYISAISTGSEGALYTASRKGTICLNGTYNFTDIPNIELNFLVEAPSTIQNSTFKQTVYIFGSSNLTLDGNTFAPTTNSVYDLFQNPANRTSLVGTEHVNLDSTATFSSRVYTGDLTLSNINTFYLQSGKTCIAPYSSYQTAVSSLASTTKVILASNLYSYFLTSTDEPLTYELGAFYIDENIAPFVTVFGTNTSTAVAKKFNVYTIGDSDVYLTGRMSAINLYVNSNTVNLGATTGSPHSGQLALFLENVNSNNYVLNIDVAPSGTSGATVQLVNTTFNSPGSEAYIHVTGNYTGHLDFTSSDNVFTDANTKHIIVLESSGNTTTLDLGNEFFPNTTYNKFFWPTLPAVTTATPFHSSGGYVAESWTNDPSYYNFTESTMYFTNELAGIKKSNNAYYGLNSWNAGATNKDLTFAVAYGLYNTGSLEISMNLTGTVSDYHSGAIYNGGVGLKTLTKTAQENMSTFTLRFDAVAKLSVSDKTVVTTFATDNLWTIEPVPLTYKIVNQINVNSFTLIPRLSTNGGASWSGVYPPYDLNSQIIVSETVLNNPGLIDLTYVNTTMPYAAEVLHFETDTSVTFGVDVSFIVTDVDNTELNGFQVAWPAYSYDSNNVTIKPISTEGAWTYRDLIAAHDVGTAVDISVFNVNAEDKLLVSSTSTFSGINSSIEITANNISLNVNTDQYEFNVDMFILSHVLDGGSLNLDIKDVLLSRDGQIISGFTLGPKNIIDINVDNTSSNVLSIADTAVPLTLACAINNEEEGPIIADSNYVLEFKIDDQRNPGSELSNPINTPIAVRINFYVPLFVYLNTNTGTGTGNNITFTDVSGETSKNVDTSFYVFLSSKFSDTDNYTIDFSLYGDNISKQFPITIDAGTKSAGATLTINQDYKIWGDAALTLTAEHNGTNVNLGNNIDYTYNELTSHSIQVEFGRAVLNGVESTSNSLLTTSFEITPTGDATVRTPLTWAIPGAYDITANGAYSAFLPITKMTPYFVEIKQASLGLDPTNISTIITPGFTLELRKFNSNNLLVEGTDYIVNKDLARLSGAPDICHNMDVIIDRESDDNVHKRLYFHLLPEADIDGSGIKLRVNVNNIAGSNYRHLDTSFSIANINYNGLGFGGTTFLELSSIKLNNWTIAPNGDGHFLEFFHDTSLYPITRLGHNGIFYN